MKMLKKIAPLLLVLAGTVVYSGSFSGAFIFDDYVWIVNNPSIQRFDTCMLGSSRPVVGISLYLNYLMGGLKAADYHLFNLLVHLSCALLIYGVLCRSVDMLKPREELNCFSNLFPFAAAILWVVHPLTTESVTYIVQRSESLMAMFYLLTLYCFIRGIRDQDREHRWFTLSIVSCAFGMACKPVMVTAPFIVLLYERLVSGKSVTAILGDKRGYYAGLAATWLILVALLSVPNESSTSAGFGALTLSPASYFLTQFDVIFRYIRLVFVPAGLCIDYDWPAAMFSVETCVKIFLVSGMLIFFIVLNFRQKAIGFAGVCFFVLLFPSSGIIPLSDCAAEHRMYLPLICAITLVLLSVGWVVERASLRFLLKGWFCIILSAMLFSVTTALGFATCSRNRDYQSEEIMWGSVVSLYPLNLRGHLGVGCGFLRKGHDDDAGQHFNLIVDDERYRDKAFAAKYATEISMALNNLGVISLKRGDYKAASNLFCRANQFGHLPDAQKNLQIVNELMEGKFGKP